MAAASQADAVAGVELVAQRARQTRTAITTASASEISAHLYITGRCGAEAGRETAGKTGNKMCFCATRTLTALRSLALRGELGT